MERKYTETDKELMLKLLEMQELTAPISLSIGSVVDGQVTQGIILHKAPPKVVEDLVKDGYSWQPVGDRTESVQAIAR